MNESTELALVGAMKDGMVDQFTFRGFHIERRAGSMAVSRYQNTPTLGGMFHMETPTVAELHEWLEEKAEYYGDNQ